MFNFGIEQKVFEICGVKIGGQPSENPPLLIGSIFYHGHKIVEDEKRGLFNRDMAESLIKLVEELSEKTKLPSALDVIGAYSNAIIKYIDFTSSITKMPILIDTLGLIEVAKTAINYAVETGIKNRIIYNSLTIKSKDEEYKFLKDSGINAAIILLYTSDVLSVNSRIKNLEIILNKVLNNDINKILIDTFVIDLPSLSTAIKTIIEVKKKYGLPCGCGAHNAISTQRKVFKDKFGIVGLKSCELATNISTIVMGADFILYGPIEAASEVFPAVYSIYTSYRYMKKMKESIQI